VPGVSSDPRHRLGRLGEELAGDHLARCGFRVLDRNYRTRWGELDLIAFDGRTLVFCEVKTRRLPGRCGQPFDAVPTRKRAQVRKIAGSWLQERRDRPYANAIRFDAIGVLFDLADRLVALEHLEGAF
jgi:putative endonuclease